MAAVPSVPAAMVSGISVPAGSGNNAPASGRAVCGAGKITPVNLLSGSGRFVSNKVLADCDICCGPYAECHICHY